MLELLRGGPRCARINSCCLATWLRSEKLLSEIYRYFEYTTVILYETMNEMNEKPQECHEYKRQLRLKKWQGQRRARLVRETNEQRERRLERHREAELQRRQTQAEQGRRAKETSQETQKRLKAQ